MRWTEETAATCIKNHKFPGESNWLEGAGSALCVFGSWAMWLDSGHRTRLCCLPRTLCSGHALFLTIHLVPAPDKLFKKKEHRSHYSIISPSTDCSGKKIPSKLKTCKILFLLCVTCRGLSRLNNLAELHKVTHYWSPPTPPAVVLTCLKYTWSRISRLSSLHIECWKVEFKKWNSNFLNWLFGGE